MSNIKKEEKLGMKLGTASNRLKKTLLYTLADKCGLLNCYRCGKRIESAKSLSIEHKESWFLSDNPVEKFFDLENIAFSHLKCNSSSVKRHTGLKKHGISGYDHHGCRCEICKQAKSKKNKKRKR